MKINQRKESDPINKLKQLSSRCYYCHNQEHQQKKNNFCKFKGKKKITLPFEASHRTTRGREVRQNLWNPFGKAPLLYSCSDFKDLTDLVFARESRRGWAKRAFVLQHLVRTDCERPRLTPEKEVAVEAMAVARRIVFQEWNDKKIWVARELKGN